jgi:hypothetical protein
MPPGSTPPAPPTTSEQILAALEDIKRTSRNTQLVALFFFWLTIAAMIIWAITIATRTN